MITEELLQMFPTKKIKSFDGMTITADVWEEAHEYHRQEQRLATLFSHGPGILTGLEVIASDPPDTAVYILAGVAIDPLGNIIVLPQPVAYDIGDEMEGPLHILLSYGESKPRRGKGDRQKDGPLYIHTEYSINARAVLPSGPWVELARINREHRDSVFHNAKTPTRPQLNEIDLRFRREVGAPQEIKMAVSYLGQQSRKTHGTGAIHLARTINQAGHYRLLVDDDVPLAPGIESSTLIYLVGEGKFELKSGQMNFLSNYVQRGRGTLFIESIDRSAEMMFLEILKAIDLEPGPLPAGYPLLVEPNLFAAPPTGYENSDTARVLVNNGVIFSTCNYGQLWLGQARQDPPSRETIRAALEWGANIVAYAVKRHRQ